MIHHKFLNPLGKALRFYAGFALTVFLLQLVGVLMYFINVWPGLRYTLSTGVTRFVGLAVILALVRSCLWIRIYWSGAGAFSILRLEGQSPHLADHISPVLKTLTRLLVVSCILDLCFVPVIFLSDRLLPFSVSGLWLGLVDLSILLFPQAFGIAALILAFLAHQYGQLLRERSQMKEEIELTI
ncbi:MAG: hypothetical protein AMJ92_10355 [candidate division Zixibacteria bacterium SM23_81]|nr:MAG: hypothetical protein AMJ92_10355 [candidate division Zixibacteria bacterium SM23_81]